MTEVLDLVGSALGRCRQSETSILLLYIRAFPSSSHMVRFRIPFLQDHQIATFIYYSIWSPSSKAIHIILGQSLGLNPQKLFPWLVDTVNLFTYHG